MLCEKPKRRAAGEDPAKRTQILDGAHIVFSRMGFDAASIADITQEAGVSKGTIYVYFDDKEDLFQALIERQRESLFEFLRQILQQGTDIRETLYRYGMALARKLLSPDTIMAQRTIIGIVSRMPDAGRNFYDKGPRATQGLLGSWLEVQCKAGVFSVPNIDLAVQQFSELCMAGQLRPRLFGSAEVKPAEDQLEENISSAVAMFCNFYMVAGKE